MPLYSTQGFNMKWMTTSISGELRLAFDAML